MFSHSYEAVVEWGDCDPAGIVFYPRFFAMFDAATALLLEIASGRTRAQLIRDYRILGWPMVDTRATFHRPVSFDDKVTIGSSVTRLGTSSFDIAHRLSLQNQLCVSASEVRAWSVTLPGDPPTTKAAPLPAELRAALACGD